jgi:aerobic carbon-monoxide dehydrogenase medium subunit
LKPSAFTYARPGSVDEALGLLRDLGEGTMVLAGGQSVVPLLNSRRIRPKQLVDIGRLSELHAIREDDNGGLAIGATTTLAELERSAAVLERFPIVVDAVSHVAHPAIRVRATVGGNLAYADPGAELPAVMTLLGAQLVLRSVGNERVVAAHDFFPGAFTSALEPGELLTEIRLPALPHGTGWGFAEISRRDGDLPMVGSAAIMQATSASFVLFGVADRPVLVTETVQPGPDVWRTIAEAATALLQPSTDVHATGDYRRQVASVLARRVLETAWSRVS